MEQSSERASRAYVGEDHRPPAAEFFTAKRGSAQTAGRPPDGPQKWSRWTSWPAAERRWELLLWSLLHFAFCYLGLLWRDRAGGVSPVWPAAGIALLAAIRLGLSVLPLLSAGKILAALASGYPADLAIASNLFDPLKAVAGAAIWFGLKDRAGSAEMSARRQVAYAAATCCAVGLVGATFGCGAYLALGAELRATDFFKWWIGDFLGAITIGAFFVQWETIRQRRDWRWWLALACFTAAVAAASSLLFSELDVALRYGFMILPLIFWSSIRYGLPGAAVVNLVFAITVLMSLGPSAHEQLYFVVALLGIGVCGGLVSAAMTEDLNTRERQSRLAAALWQEAHVKANEQERQLRTLFDQLPDAVLLHQGARVLHLNRVAQRLRERMGANANREWWDRLREQPTNESTPSFYSLPAASGGVLEVEVRRSNLLWHGQEVGLMVLRDYTLQSEAERKLRESELSFSRFFQLNPAASVIVEMESAKIVEVNESFERLFLFSRADAIGRSTISDLHLWTDPSEREKLIRTVVQNREVRAMRQHMRRKDGAVILVEFSTREIQAGNQRLLFSILEDITERTRIEEALRQNKERYRMLLENLHDIVIEADEQGRCLYVSSSAAGVLGFPVSEIEGAAFSDLLHPEDRVEWSRQVIDEQGNALRLRARTAKRGWLPIECTHRWVRTDSGARRAVITVYDISERVRASAERSALESQLRQAQKLEAIGTLAGGIAHDFNNVLTSIMGHAQLAEMESGAKRDVRPHMQEILGASRRARDLVAKILTFSRKTEPKLESVRLSDAIREVAGLIRAAMPANISLSLDLSEDDPTVIGDPTQIHQVLLNLCTNSVHAMRGRGGLLYLGLARVLPQTRPADTASDVAAAFMQITVRDSGCGMSEEVLGRIFEPFFTTKPAHEGTGLGLSVVHGIMQAHHGRVSVKSRVGEGTEFELLFPLPPQPAAAPAPILAEGATLPRGRGELVLVVDDEEGIVSLVCSLLRSLGYDAQGYTDPSLVTALLRKETPPPEAIICDYSMPQMSGIELASTCANRGAVFLLMSGLVGAEERARARAAGISRIITKPLDLASFAQILASALEERRAATNSETPLP